MFIWVQGIREAEEDLEAIKGPSLALHGVAELVANSSYFGDKLISTWETQPCLLPAVSLCTSYQPDSLHRLERGEVPPLSYWGHYVK